MKHAALVALLIVLSGCKLFPKKVEFFQDKVRAVPAKTETTKERERQAADFVAQKTDQAYDAAVENSDGPEVLSPLSDARIVSESLSLSLGPPSDPWKREAERLADDLRTAQAKYNRAIEKFRKQNDENSGKKIEGTGFLQVGYFTYLLVVGGSILVLLLALRIGLGIYGAMNPAVGGVLKVSSALAGRAVDELAYGGKKFVGYLDKLDLDDKAKTLVHDLFIRSHKEAQSRDVQQLVQSLPHNVPVG